MQSVPTGAVTGVRRSRTRSRQPSRSSPSITKSAGETAATRACRCSSSWSAPASDLSGDEVPARASSAASRGPCRSPCTPRPRGAGRPGARARRRPAAAVERVAGREGQPVRRGDDQPAAGPQHPCGVAHEGVLVPQVLHDLAADHDVGARVGEGERDQVRPHRMHAGMMARDMSQGRLVEVQPGDQGGAGLGEERPAVPLAAPGLDHHGVPHRHLPAHPAVRRDVPLVPVVLPRHAGQRPLTGELEAGGMGRRRHGVRGDSLSDGWSSSQPRSRGQA